MVMLRWCIICDMGFVVRNFRLASSQTSGQALFRVFSKKRYFPEYSVVYVVPRNGPSHVVL